MLWSCLSLGRSRRVDVCAWRKHSAVHRVVLRPQIVLLDSCSRPTLHRSYAPMRHRRGTAPAAIVCPSLLPPTEGETAPRSRSDRVVSRPRMSLRNSNHLTFRLLPEQSSSTHCSVGTLTATLKAQGPYLCHRNTDIRYIDCPTSTIPRARTSCRPARLLVRGASLERRRSSSR